MCVWCWRSSRSEKKPQTVEEIREAVKGKAKLNMALRMIEVLLFRPPANIEEEPKLLPRSRWPALFCINQTVASHRNKVKLASKVSGPKGLMFCLLLKLQSVGWIYQMWLML